MELSAADLEAQIDAAVLRLATAKEPSDRRATWDKLCGLVKQRTPERIRDMERERGLA